MIIRNSWPLINFRDCFCLSTRSPFFNFNPLGMYTSRRLFNHSRSDFEDPLLLSNPLAIVLLKLSQESSLLPSLDERTQSNLIDLSLKPTIKIDKKVKKNDKDDDREIEKLKFKVKKKVRSRVNFDEDYDSVNELFESSQILQADSLFPLARPPKPTPLSDTGVSFVSKQKTTSNKKKSSSSVQKKVENIEAYPKPEKVSLRIPLSVQDLSDLFKVSTTDIIKSLFLKGIPVTVNQLVDSSIAQKLANEFGILIEDDKDPLQSEVKTDFRIDRTTKGSESRAPIVTIIGHVDHGKTTLLDKIRKTQVAQKEAGGITQRIGAYEVIVDVNDESKKIIFLDTPGHEAFSGMRLRGVSITDIVILVVAADDGVKPQTIEAIKSAQMYNVPILVAINKIDKENADVEGIKRELSQFNLIAEDWGGDTLMVPISAIQETNLDRLLEMITLLADVLDLTADSNSVGKGIILESHLDRSRGPVASILVQNGTFNVGDTVTFNNRIGKVRGMTNSLLENIREAGPSSPIILWGLPTVPSVGEKIFSFRDEKEAKAFGLSNNKSSDTLAQQPLIDTQFVLSPEVRKRLSLIIKTDSQGSSEAINSVLSRLNSLDIKLHILYSCAGEVTETDVEFASTSDATILAFNTTSASGAKKLAKSSSILIQEFDVVYDLLDYVQTLIDSLVGPQYDEKLIGKALVRTVFPLAKSFVAGSLVMEGKVTNTSFIHVLRGNEILYKGSITSLKRIKENVNEVSSDLECGIFIDTFDTWRSDDIIEAFDRIPKKKNRL